MDDETKNWVLGLSIAAAIVLGISSVNAWSQNSELKESNEFLSSEVSSLEESVGEKDAEFNELAEDYEEQKSRAEEHGERLNTLADDISYIQGTWFDSCWDLRDEIDSLDTSGASW